MLRGVTEKVCKGSNDEPDKQVACGGALPVKGLLTQLVNTVMKPFV